MRIILLLILFFAVSASAEELELSGHLKGQFNYTRYSNQDLINLLGPQNSFDGELDFRLNGSKNFNRLTTNFAFELLGAGGQSFSEYNQLSSLSPFQGNDFEERRLFDLSKTILNDRDAELITRIDRANISYQSDSLSLTLGRHAISWGNGLAFQVFDLFNPFEPLAVDKEYKSGDDMLYLQYLFEQGDDLQLLAVPRRELLSGDLKEEQSSFALLGHFALTDPSISLNTLIARHYQDHVFGAGLSTSIRDGVFRADFTATNLHDGDTEYSFIFNYDRSFVLFEHNIYAFLEYLRNGFGVRESEYASLPEYLLRRVERGELFTLNRDYLALGARVELTALTNLFATQIHNLDDSSGALQLRLVYDYLQDLQLMFGFNLPYGKTGSEFGGLELTLPSGTAQLGSDLQAFTRISFYY